MQIKSYIYIVLFITLISSCRKAVSPSTQTSEAIKVDLLVVSNQTETYTHTHLGRIEQAATIPLSMQTSGTIINKYISKGDRVSKGQILLQIDTLQAYNALQIAQANLTAVQDGYDRAQQMHLKGGITEQKMVELQSQLQQAKSMASIAKKQLDDCTLKASRDGIISDCDIQIGQEITPAMPLITLLDIEHFNVTFDVPEQEVMDIQIGDKGYTLVEAIHSDSLPIVVTEKSLVANHLSHTYTIKAKIATTSIKQQPLLPGMMSKVFLSTQQINGITIPPTCIHTQLNETNIWVVHHGKAIRKPVVVGKYTNQGVLITQGLTAGDSVIVSGYQKLYNGAPLTF